MALVRCSCIADTTIEPSVRRVTIVVPDPDCAVAPHRAAAGDSAPEVLPG